MHCDENISTMNMNHVIHFLFFLLQQWYYQELDCLLFVLKSYPRYGSVLSCGPDSRCSELGLKNDSEETFLWVPKVPVKSSLLALLLHYSPLHLQNKVLNRSIYAQTSVPFSVILRWRDRRVLLPSDSVSNLSFPLFCSLNPRSGNWFLKFLISGYLRNLFCSFNNCVI